MEPLVDLHYLTHQLAEADGPADLAGEWPERLWSIMEDHGALTWLIPSEFGGVGLDRLTLMDRYMAIAEGSLTAAFMLTQHDAALRRMIPAAVAEEGRNEVASEWLKRIVEEKLSVTVAISQLTTSIRRGERAMVAKMRGAGRVELGGSMPWVTGAERAACFVTGGTMEDGRQVLVLVPADTKGLKVLPPEPLAALNASRTTEVLCDGVVVDATHILAGPVENVITSRQAGGTGGLETSALALGQAKAAIEMLKSEDSGRFGLDEPVESLVREWMSIHRMICDVLSGETMVVTPEQIRRRANALVSRATQACLIARRGSGFLMTDPAQRWVRQALFFHVWSCPRPVASAAIRDLAGIGEQPACGL